MVLVNDQNRYVIVLYGLKAKDFKRLDELILQGIRESFQEECVKDEVIERFLQGTKEITYTKTKDRTCVARMNKACENVYYFEEFMDYDSIINTSISIRVSNLLAGYGKNSYIYPNEEMYKDLELFSEGPIFRTQAAVLKVTLKLEKHNVWRRIVVPVNSTFSKVHKILQSAFGWKDRHLHEFYIYDDATSDNAKHKPIINLVSNEEALGYTNEVEMKLEKGVKLLEYIPTYKELIYHYDFGDNWEHDIVVERMINDYDVNYPVCLEGEGTTPPEDVGGEHGYEAFLKIIADENHPDYKHMFQWGRMHANEDFDIEQVNRMLKYI